MEEWDRIETAPAMEMAQPVIDAAGKVCEVCEKCSSMEDVLMTLITTAGGCFMMYLWFK